MTISVTAKIRNIDKAGGIIDAVAIAGGDLTRIDGISFSVDDPSSYYTEARKLAVADAKAKASSLESAAPQACAQDCRGAQTARGGNEKTKINSISYIENVCIDCYDKMRKQCECCGGYFISTKF